MMNRTSYILLLSYTMVLYTDIYKALLSA